VEFKQKTWEYDVSERTLFCQGFQFKKCHYLLSMSTDMSAVMTQVCPLQLVPLANAFQV
jgi:hypothetical protein